jgi:hypothetical protein
VGRFCEVLSLLVELLVDLAPERKCFESFFELLVAFSVLGTATLSSSEVGITSGLARQTREIYRKKGSLVPS